MKAMRYPGRVFTDRSNRQWPQPEQSRHKGDVLQWSGPRVITSVNPLVITTLRTGLNIRPVSYAERGGEVWWSNGEESGRCNSDNSDHPWTVPAPLDIVSVVAGTGTLPVGTYRVCITHSMTNGEESHASTIETLTLTSPGSVDVTRLRRRPGRTISTSMCRRLTTTSCRSTAQFLLLRLASVLRHIRLVARFVTVRFFAHFQRVTQFASSAVACCR